MSRLFVILIHVLGIATGYFYDVSNNFCKSFLRCSWRKYMSSVMGKPTYFICENKGADQLRGNREADQRLCFRYMDTAIPLLL